MRVVLNFLWLIFGGLEAAAGYLTASIFLAATIVGIPFAVQIFKLGLLCLWPFGASVEKKEDSCGCLTLPMNLIWFFFGGIWACLCHILFGLLLMITIIGIPWGRQHFKMAGLALSPFGREVKLGL